MRRVPDLAAPGPASPSAVTLVLAAVAVVGVVAFLLVVFNAGRLAGSPRRLLGWFLGSLALVALPVAGLAFSTEHTKEQQRERDAAYRDAVDAAQAAAARELLDRYGVTVERAYTLPVFSGVHGDVDLTFADGSTGTCLVGTFDHEYTLRCGSSSWDEATPLESAG